MALIATLTPPGTPLVPIAPSYGESHSPTPSPLPPVPTWRGRTRLPERRACPRARVFILCGTCGASNHIRCAYCKSCFVAKAPVPAAGGGGVVADGNRNGSSGGDSRRGGGSGGRDAGLVPSPPQAPPLLPPMSSRLPPLPPLPSRHVRGVPRSPPPPPPPSMPLPSSPPHTPSSSVPTMVSAWVLCTWPMVPNDAAKAGDADTLRSVVGPAAAPVTAAVPAGGGFGQNGETLPPLSAATASVPEEHSRVLATAAGTVGVSTTTRTSPEPALSLPRAPRPRGVTKPRTPPRRRPTAIASRSSSLPAGHRAVFSGAAVGAGALASYQPSPDSPPPYLSLPHTLGTSTVSATQHAAGRGPSGPRTPLQAPSPGPAAVTPPASSWSLLSAEPTPLPTLPPPPLRTGSPPPVAMAGPCSEAGGGSGSGDDGEWWDISAAALPWAVTDPTTQAVLRDAGTFLDEILGASPEAEG